MSRMQRNKGAAFERETANLFKPIYPAARRGLGQARAAGEVPDVDGTEFWVECKAHRQVRIPAAYQQGVEASAGRRPVVVVSKDNHGITLATLSFDDFFELVRQASGLTEGELASARERLAAERTVHQATRQQPPFAALPTTTILPRLGLKAPKTPAEVTIPRRPLGEPFDDEEGP